MQFVEPFKDLSADRQDRANDPFENLVAVDQLADPPVEPPGSILPTFRPKALRMPRR
jgi:hypothetical protein